MLVNMRILFIGDIVGRPGVVCVKELVPALRKTEKLDLVMDNGAVVPEPLRQKIFEPSFVWNPGSAERTGRSS